MTTLLTNPSIRQLWERLAASKRYRDNFAAGFVKRSIPSQIRAWMKEQEVTQQQLADRSGLTQGVISRAANPNYGDLTINTIIKIGVGLDCVFVGRYVPYSEFLKTVVTQDTNGSNMLSFEQENHRSDEIIGALERDSSEEQPQQEVDALLAESDTREDNIVCISKGLAKHENIAEQTQKKPNESIAASAQLSVGGM